MVYKCLTIAGFDGSGGAGVQADLKTFTAFGCYGMSVLTSMPIQNTQGVFGVFEIPVETIVRQMDAIFSDIVPDAIKIGMIFSAEIAHSVADFLKKYAGDIPIVLDPVIIAKSGDKLLQDDALSALKTRLLPLASIVTPNIPEAMALSGQSYDTDKIALAIMARGAKSVLMKGGHARDEHSNDVLYTDDGVYTFLADRVRSNNTHGTGCTLSAAICAMLSRGHDMKNSCIIAKKYVLSLIKESQYKKVGLGNGPLLHFSPLEEEIDIMIRRYNDEIITESMGEIAIGL